MKSRMREMTAHRSRRARPTQLPAPVLKLQLKLKKTNSLKQSEACKLSLILVSSLSTAIFLVSWAVCTGSDVAVRRVLPEVDRRRGKVMVRPWSSGAVCSCLLFALPAVGSSAEREGIIKVQGREFSTELDPLRPRTWR